MLPRNKGTFVRNVHNFLRRSVTSGFLPDDTIRYAHELVTPGYRVTSAPVIMGSALDSSPDRALGLASSRPLPPNAYLNLIATAWAFPRSKPVLPPPLSPQVPSLTERTMIASAPILAALAFSLLIIPSSLQSCMMVCPVCVVISPNSVYARSLGGL